MSEILDQWEAEANSAPKYQGEARPLIQQYRMRVLALIELVRKKDEALKTYANGKHWAEFISTDGNIFDEQDGDPVFAFSEGNGQPSYAAQEALALTKELK